MKPLLSSRPKGRHRRVEPKTRGNAAAVVAVAVVGGTAISASATSSAPASNTPSAEAERPSAEPSQSQAPTTRTPDAQRVAHIKAQRVARAKQQAQERAERAAAKAAKARLAAAHRWVTPMKSSYQFTSEFGPRWGRLHAGIDLAAPVGTPVAAMSSGVVTFAGQKSGYGTALVIEYWDGTKSLYGHLHALRVSQGQRVTPGQLVALSGNTGHSTGPHLHLEIRPKDSAANTMSRRGKHVSNRAPHADFITTMASNDIMARAGVEPAPVDPVPWMRTRHIAPHGAH